MREEAHDLRRTAFSTEAAVTVVYVLVALGQITLRKSNGYRELAAILASE